MRGVKLGPLPREDDPASLAAHRLRYMNRMAARNYCAETIGDRGRDLHAFILWAEDRGMAEPRDVSEPAIEGYQRHLFRRRKEDGRPLAFRTQALRLGRVRLFFKWLAKEKVIRKRRRGTTELSGGQAAAAIGSAA